MTSPSTCARCGAALPEPETKPVSGWADIVETLCAQCGTAVRSEAYVPTGRILIWSLLVAAVAAASLYAAR